MYHLMQNIIDITGNIYEHIIVWLIQPNDVHLSLVMFRGISGASQRRFDSLVEGDEVGRVQGIVADAVLVLAHALTRSQHRQPQQKVVGEYHEYFHPATVTLVFILEDLDGLHRSKTLYSPNAIFLEIFMLFCNNIFVQCH